MIRTARETNKSMQPLKGIVMAMLAGTVILAQEPNTPAANKPLTGDPGVQADRLAAQTPPAQSKTSMATWDANSRNFMGTIVDANCSQASSLTMRYSAADAAPKDSTSTDSTKPNPGSTTISKNYKSVYDLQREVLKHCPATNSTTAFAVVTDDGSFYKLDDAGNTQVTSLSGASESEKQKKTLKNMRVTGSGTVQGDALKVGSLTKSDKPFGGS
jgi:hypothetical protein